MALITINNGVQSEAEDRLWKAVEEQNTFKDDLALVIRNTKLSQSALARSMGEHPQTIFFWIHRGSLPRRIYSYLFIHNWARDIREQTKFPKKQPLF